MFALPLKMLRLIFTWFCFFWWHHAELDHPDEIRFMLIMALLFLAGFMVLFNTKTGETRFVCTGMGAVDNKSTSKPAPKEISAILKPKFEKDNKAVVKLAGTDHTDNEQWHVESGNMHFYVQSVVNRQTLNMKEQQVVKIQISVLFVFHAVLLLYQKLAMDKVKLSLMDDVLKWNNLILLHAMDPDPMPSWNGFTLLFMQAYAVHNAYFPERSYGIMGNFVFGPALAFTTFLVVVYKSNNMVPGWLFDNVKKYLCDGSILLVFLVFLAFYWVAGYILSNTAQYCDGDYDLFNSLQLPMDIIRSKSFIVCSSFCSVALFLASFLFNLKDIIFAIVRMYLSIQDQGSWWPRLVSLFGGK